MSKDVNKLISDAEVAILIAEKMHRSYCELRHVPGGLYDHRLASRMDYLIASMLKQKMWLLNYRDRKDIAMSLVFNLVTQQDASNNMDIAKDMRRDSSSLNGIGLLTMIFLPGTFTSVRSRGSHFAHIYRRDRQNSCNRPSFVH